MTSKERNIILCLTLIMFCFKSGESILCYDCNSLYDPRCGDEFDSFSLGVVNCSLRDPLEHLPELEPTLCRTIKMEILEKTRVVRQCGYIRDEATDDSCQIRTGIEQMSVTYCSCSTDLCNEARFVDINIILFLVFTVLIYVIC